jgi:hypothetical protein
LITFSFPYYIGIKPTKDTRLVNLTSIESLIMVLGELKHHRVSRDHIQKTFENAAYSFMIEERCPFHCEIGISHCSVARCHAGAKLISAYLNQLYVPERPASITMTEKHSQNSFVNNMSNRVQQSGIVRYKSSNESQRFKKYFFRPTMTSQRLLSSQYSLTDSNDSIASSYYPPKQKTQQNFYQSNNQITKLQKQNFHRLLSNAESTVPATTTTNNNYLSEYTIEDDNHSGIQRTILNQRKQILLDAIQSIDKQIEELDLE